MIRVGFIISDWGDSWIGGRTYLQNLLGAVASLEKRRIEAVLIVPPSMPDSILDGLPPVEVVRDSLVAANSKIYAAGKGMRRFLGRNFVMEYLARKYRIDVFSHTDRTGRASPLPSITWIPDFQHVRVPEFFSRAERLDRDNLFRRQIENARIVVVSSENARRDLAAFAPHSASKTRVLHFVAGLGGNNTANLRELQAKYHFNGPYFHLPNQYWLHKNHTIALNALALLRSRGFDATILSTGATHDYRNPGYFKTFEEQVRELGLENSFRILGLVPHRDMASLFFHSIAIINPSRFEGWSTTVEEAKSSGKTVLLSDIPVHREQDPPHGKYFSVDSASELADLMATTIANHNPLSEMENRSRAARRLPQRISQFAAAFENIVLDATASVRT